MRWWWKADDSAYEKGFEAGYLGTTVENPYWTGSKNWNEWERGWLDGCEIILAPTHTINFRREDGA